MQTKLESFGLPVIEQRVFGRGDYQCPYCLYTSKLKNDFYIIGPKGKVSTRMALCPGCYNTVRFSTLIDIARYDIVSYAKWIFDVKQFDVNHRIKWEKIKAVLRENDLSNAFWDAYYIERETKTGKPKPEKKTFINNGNLGNG